MQSHPFSLYHCSVRSVLCFLLRHLLSQPAASLMRMLMLYCLNLPHHHHPCCLSEQCQHLCCPVFGCTPTTTTPCRLRMIMLPLSIVQTAADGGVESITFVEDIACAECLEISALFSASLSICLNESSKLLYLNCNAIRVSNKAVGSV